ncbi:MAG TPA: LytTR family transcriptional regulator DNA-binding domain-containing protein [Terriglobia bacterium]|nr:LytTR family transcriptional regulator DNA-binding domain-containing protein [Terriglobia bacterium]
MIRAYLVDDERLALERLARMLEATGRVEIIGMSRDPVEAVAALRAGLPDVLFLDIQMPELSGFELLAELPEQPLVVFTTAYDRYALEAFRVNSIDYLLKPIEPDHLERALAKAERMSRQGERPVEMRALLAQINATLQLGKSPWLDRIASRVGDKVEPIDLRRVTHFYSKDKLTYAATLERSYVVDNTVAELESRLNPVQFIRIHRGAILNLDHLLELHAMFGGRMVARLKDGKKTELPVSRDRVSALKSRLGL